MKKISTLFKKNPENLGRVINEIDPENEWALTEGIATRKFDGTACAIIDGKLYKRYDAKRKKKDGMFKVVPEGAIPCQDADEITGHWPHWMPCDREDHSNKWHFQAYDDMAPKIDGTYELCGPKVQGNPEYFKWHQLVRHGEQVMTPELTFNGIKNYLENHRIEGLVFHHPNGKMCKIRQSDFGLTRQKWILIK